MTRWWSSLTVRLAVASAAWTIGLLYLTHLASVLLLFGPEAVTRFGPRVAPTLMLALAAMGCGAFIVRRALQHFRELRRRVLDVHEGRDRTVGGQYLTEVQPVVTALNDLLTHQDRRVQDALAKAGDLAHGLKTPLAVLNHEASRADMAGHPELAASVRQQVERMRRHIDYHLAHARAAASGLTPGTSCPVSDSADAIVRTLHRLHAGRGLAITVHVAPQSRVRVERADLDEMLGNLLDNACKWSRSTVILRAEPGEGAVVITVEDDGPGIAPELRNAVLQRGVRADEATPGSGLGLAIVRDLAGLYGGSIALDTSPLGGLRAALRLPPAVGEHS